MCFPEISVFVVSFRSCLILMRTPPFEARAVGRGADPRSCSSSNPLLTFVNLSQTPSLTGDVDLSTPADSNGNTHSRDEYKVKRCTNIHMHTTYIRTTRRTRRIPQRFTHNRCILYTCRVYISIHKTNQRKQYVIYSAPRAINPTDIPLSYDSDCAHNPS